MNLAALNINEFEACQKCTLCDSFCPVLQVEPSFPGPKLVGANAVRLAAGKGVITPAVELELCTDCRVCNTVCPSGIKPATLIAKQRWQGKEGKRWFVRGLILGRPDRIGRMVSLWPSLANLALKQKSVRRVAARVAGITATRRFPAYMRPTFNQWYAGARGESAAAPQKVVYFHGCYANFNRPDLGQRLVQFLASFGIGVIVPEQHCCGLPLTLNGDVAKARALAQNNLTHLLPYVEEGVPVIFSCPSCASMFKSYYPEIYGLPDAKKIARLCFDACEFILARLAGGLIRDNARPVPRQITYHAPCHLRAQGIGSPALALMSLVPELKVYALGNNCCGMAGTYGYKAEKYDLSMQIGAPLFQDIKEHQPDLVVTDCGTCALQITEGTGFKVVHPVDLLWQAWRTATT